MSIEIIGYAGSALVVISMLMTSVIKLRVINLIGSSIFTIYAIVIRSYPTALMNFCLVAINIYNLIRLVKNTKSYDLVEESSDSSFVTYILEHYKKDIQMFFPDFHMGEAEIDTAYIICTDTVPAGLLLGKMRRADAMEIILDYSTPMFRDCSVGEYLYSELEKKGVHEFICSEAGGKHKKYLKKWGFFQLMEDRKSGLEKEIKMNCISLRNACKQLLRHTKLSVCRNSFYNVSTGGCGQKTGLLRAPKGAESLCILKTKSTLRYRFITSAVL